MGPGGDAPLLPQDGPAGAQALWLRAADGVRLRVVRWPEGPRGSVLILPGRTEWAEKYALVAAVLAARGWGAVAVDWRGQGLADRALPDPLPGHVGDFAEYQRDLRAVLDWAAGQGLGPMPWLAHSMGGCIALRGLTGGHRPPAVALSAPMWDLANPAPVRALLRGLAGVARGMGREAAYTPTTGPRHGLPTLIWPDNPLTRDRDSFARMQAQFRAVPQVQVAGPTLGWMGAALAEVAALARLPSPPVPAVIGLGEAERIVSNPAIRARAARWRGAVLSAYPGARHELLMEEAPVRDDLMGRALALFERV